MKLWGPSDDHFKHEKYMDDLMLVKGSYIRNIRY